MAAGRGLGGAPGRRPGPGRWRCPATGGRQALPAHGLLPRPPILRGRRFLRPLLSEQVSGAASAPARPAWSSARGPLRRAARDILVAVPRPLLSRLGGRGGSNVLACALPPPGAETARYVPGRQDTRVGARHIRQQQPWGGSLCRDGQVFRQSPGSRH